MLLLVMSFLCVFQYIMSDDHSKCVYSSAEHILIPCIRFSHPLHFTIVKNHNLPVKHS